MMGIMVPETCWANNKFCNKNQSVASSWPFITTQKCYVCIHKYRSPNFSKLLRFCVPASQGKCFEEDYSFQVSLQTTLCRQQHFALELRVKRACSNCTCQSVNYQPAEVFSPGNLRCTRPIFIYTTKRPDTKLSNNKRFCMSRLWDAMVGTAVSKEPDISTLIEEGKIKMKAAKSDKSLINVCNYQTIRCRI